MSVCANSFGAASVNSHRVLMKSIEEKSWSFASKNATCNALNIQHRTTYSLTHTHMHTHKDGSETDKTVPFILIQAIMLWCCLDRQQRIRTPKIILNHSVEHSELMIRRHTETPKTQSKKRFRIVFVAVAVDVVDFFFFFNRRTELANDWAVVTTAAAPVRLK